MLESEKEAPVLKYQFRILSSLGLKFASKFFSFLIQMISVKISWEHLFSGIFEGHTREKNRYLNFTFSFIKEVPRSHEEPHSEGLVCVSPQHCGFR